MDKAHILNEIRRTADVNGGKPLGVARFFEQTGIKESDWRGKHWARWGDALVEAGLARNSLQAPFAEDLILDRLVQITRQLGRIPVVSEMRLARRADPTFPNSKTILGRFGGKDGLLERLRAYLNDRPEDHDVLSLIPLPSDAEPTAKDVSGNIEFAFVYLLKSGKYWKLGRSNSIGRRQYELAIQLPEKTTLVHEIRTDDPIGIEAYWHRRFAERRMNGEWFALTNDDIAAFKRRKFM
jgi:hypothetical protein